MALFAAYAEASKETRTNQSETESNRAGSAEDTSWLTNSSFKIDVTPFQPEELVQLHPGHSLELVVSSSSDDNAGNEDIFEEKSRKRHKKSKSKKAKSRKRKKTVEADIESEEYTIDKKRVNEYKNVNTIARPVAPKYKIYKYLELSKKRKPKKFKRYFQVIIDRHVNKSNSEAEKVTANDLATVDKSKQGPAGLKGQEQEEHMTQTTAAFNRDLQADPNDIDTWIGYVKFQDTVFAFEKSFRKGSIAKGLRVTAERKLSILDKALAHNPSCDDLHRLRVHIASVFPADELRTYLGALVKKDPGNIILWQGFIEATQCSMSHCTTPAVLELYIECLNKLHTLRRTARGDRANLEENILRMLYQCGLFLKQAGLFEQLWTLLRMYLELNLTPGSFSSFTSPSEGQLEELEEVVLKSQLPIHELWLRVEKLREAAHWLPVSTECADPQRVVFNEDVSELIHPITMPGNSFKLTVAILTLLKVPLLPCRHTTMQEFGIDYVPWSLDSVETLLPIFMPSFPCETDPELLNFVQKLAVGPQYLKTLPGQEEYLQFVLATMQGCINCFSDSEQDAMTVWWFRFHRLLIILEGQSVLKTTQGFKKKVKGDMRSLLKANPSNVSLFTEYAMFEYSRGERDSALGILQTAISQSLAQADKDLFTLPFEERAALISALRKLIELNCFTCAETDFDTVKDKCVKYICAVVTGSFPITELPRFVTQGVVNDTREKFTEIIATLNNGDTFNDMEVTGHFLPDFVTDWLILNGYLLYLKNSLGECRIFLENILSSEAPYLTRWRKEVLHEFLVAILLKTVETPGSGLYPILDRHLQKGIEVYPNNLFLLGSLARVQGLQSGQPWWKVQNLLLKSEHALSTVFLVLIAQQRMRLMETWTDSVTGQLIDASGPFKNRMLNLFKRLTRSDMCSRRCGLIWRLYLQFLHGYFDAKVLRDAYYLAVEECPWLKSLYIDAAIYIPADLAQIQDLIIEKQLRIHVTPEELDVLRS